MSGSEHDELIQGEIDGVNSTAESARLKALLLADPALQTRFASLGRAAEALGKAERLAPPPGFIDDVMREVRRRKQAAETRSGWWESLRGLLAPVPLAACASALVIGVVLGAFLPPEAALSSRSERAAVSGTALSGGRLAAPAVLDRQPIAREGVRGEAVTRIDQGLLVVELVLDADLPVDVSLELEGTGLSPRSFSQDGPSGRDLVIAKDGVRFTHPAGGSRYSLSFASGEPAARTLRLRVGDDGGLDLAIRKGEGPD